MIVVNVKYAIKEGMRDAFLEAIKQERVAEQVRSEAGNRQYVFLLPVEESDVNTLYLIEKYADEAALENHKRESHFEAFQDIKAQFVNDTIVQVFKE